jgi:hypothetical protein
MLEENFLQYREHIPEELRRRVLVEAGHRCAIPTCRYPEVDIAHIVPYRIVKKHEYANLIALCDNCHRRADKGEIDRKSLKVYKRILQRLTDRYERFELTVLNQLRQGENVILAGNMTLLIKNIVDDGFVSLEEGGISVDTFPINVTVHLTEKGKEFIKEWIHANKELTYWKAKK